MSFRRRRLSKSEKRILKKEQNGSCFYCGDTLHDRTTHEDDFNSDPKWACVDHMTPFSLGGDTDLENCVLSCRSCNSKKWTMIAEQFVEAMSDE